MNLFSVFSLFLAQLLVTYIGVQGNDAVSTDPDPDSQLAGVIFGQDDVTSIISEMWTNKKCLFFSYHPSVPKWKPSNQSVN